MSSIQEKQAQENGNKHLIHTGHLVCLGTEAGHFCILLYTSDYLRNSPL